MGKDSSQCAQCKKDIAPAIPVGRRDECEHCGADLHACLNCKFYDTGSYNDCKESSASIVREKHRSNFCDYFVWQSKAYAKDQASSQLAAAEALFKK